MWTLYTGSIVIVTPATGLVPQKPIRRLKSMLSEAQIANIANIALQIYNYIAMKV